LVAVPSKKTHDVRKREKNGVQAINPIYKTDPGVAASVAGKAYRGAGGTRRDWGGRGCRTILPGDERTGKREEDSDKRGNLQYAFKQ